MKVLNDYVVILEDGKQEQTESGLYIPAAATNKSAIRKGVVLECGETCSKIESGSSVIFNIVGSNSIEHDGKNMVIVKAENVIAVV